MPEPKPPGDSSGENAESASEAAYADWIPLQCLGSCGARIRVKKTGNSFFPAESTSTKAMECRYGLSKARSHFGNPGHIWALRCGDMALAFAPPT